MYNDRLLKRLLGCIAAVLLLVSCNNKMEDYYNKSADAVSHGKVLEYLQSDPDYSEFIKLLNETGVIKTIQGETLVTIYAPTNSSLSADVASMSTEEKIRLVKNHISLTILYTRNLARLDRLKTEAGKFLTIEQIEGRFIIDHAQITETDIICVDGVVHKMANWLLPRKNLYQLLQELPDTYSIFRDSVLKHNVRRFDRENSKIIGIDENGQVVYDSIWIIDNDIFNNIDLNNEDARYTLFAPDNSALAAMMATTTDYLKNMEYMVTAEDSARWRTWIFNASLMEGIIEFEPERVYRSIHENEVRSDFFSVSTAQELSNGRFYPMTKCYAPKILHMAPAVSYNPYYIRKAASSFLHNPAPKEYDNWSTVNNVNSKLDDVQLIFFPQYSTTAADNFYQFKSFTWDIDETEKIKLSPLNVMPGFYDIYIRLVSDTKVNPADNTDKLDLYQIVGGDDKLLTNIIGIKSNRYNVPATGGLVAEKAKLTGDKFAPVELKLVIPGSFSVGEKRRIRIGQVTLVPTLNNY